MDFELDRRLARLLQNTFDMEMRMERPTNDLLHEDRRNIKIQHRRKSSSPVRDRKNINDRRSLSDPSWEISDPSPDIHDLFRAFNKRFFYNKLGEVILCWSNRLLTSAGVCSYEGHRGRMKCTIDLSARLLKLRPRKDLVETLLHEMIHALLFITNNNKDRDGHGPEFHKHMRRINKEAGTKISVYHDFHDEVKFYKQHWWRCDGPCRSKRPKYGFVRRAMDRAPGPHVRWWTTHNKKCGGTFIKVREGGKSPKKPKQRKDRNNNNPTKTNKPNNNRVKKRKCVIAKQSDKVDKIKSIRDIEETTDNEDETQTEENLVNCPICNSKIAQDLINKHLDSCLSEIEIKKINDPDSVIVPSITIDNKNEMFKCEICHENMDEESYNRHFAECLKKIYDDIENNYGLEEPEIEETTACLVCGKMILKHYLDIHLETCMEDMFDEDDTNCHKNCENDTFDEDEDGDGDDSKLYHCPICTKLFPEDKMNDHIDQCLNN